MGTAISFTTRVARGRSTGRTIATRVTSVATGVSALGTSLGAGGTRLGSVSGRVTEVRTGGVGTRAGTTRSTGGTRTRSILGGLLTDNIDTSRVLTGLGWAFRASSHINIIAGSRPHNFVVRQLFCVRWWCAYFLFRDPGLRPIGFRRGGDEKRRERDDC